VEENWRIGDFKMRARAPDCLVRARGYIRGLGEDNTEPVLLYVEQEGGFCPFLLQMPDDILLLLTRFLSIEDIFRMEQVCRSLRDLIVDYGVYKVRLDSICRRKRINNYMALSERAREQRTLEEVSAYYKLRLYHYTHKSRVRVGEDEDEYIQTYKVGRKKAELDRLVQRSLRRFSLSGV